MEITNLFADEDAVSPVIGVILMVAITVILAAVIGAFVLGFGGGGPSAPSVSWDTSTSDSVDGSNGVIFKHGGGDTIDEPETLTATGDTGSNDLGYLDGGSITTTDLSTVDPLTTGDQLAVNGLSSDGTVNLIWNNPDGDSTQELASVDYDFS